MELADWLQIGASFPSDDTSGASGVSTALVRVKEKSKKRSKHSHSHRKRKQREEEEEEEDACEEQDASLSDRRRHKRSSSSSTRQRRHHHSDSRDHKSHHRKHRLRERSPSRSPSSSGGRRRHRSPSSTTSRDLMLLEDTWEAQSDATCFKVDRKGDHENVLFGSSYAHDVPLYELACRKVMGAVNRVVPRSSVIHRNDLKQRALSRYFGQEALQMERDASQRRLYLAYNDKRLQRAQEESASTVSSSKPALNFIPVDPPAFDQDQAGDNGGVLTMAPLQTDLENMEEHLVARSKQFNKQLEENPKNAKLWLDFCAFQEETMRLHTSMSGRLISSRLRSIVDKQMMILSKAMTKNPTSKLLQRAFLNLSLRQAILQDTAEDSTPAMDLFESGKQQIEVFLSKEPTNEFFWRKLVSWNMQKFGSFSVQLLRDLYARILFVYRKELVVIEDDETDGSSLSSSSRLEQVATQLMKFHEEMCLLEHRSGFTERAIAHFQALLEVNLLFARDFSLGEQQIGTRFERFESFWEQEFPRLGEDNGSNDTSEKLVREAWKPSDESRQQYLMGVVTTSLERINPPKAIRSEHHERTLLDTVGDKYLSRTGNQIFNPEKPKDMSSIKQRESEPDRSEPDQDDKEMLVYSNLHGYRIRMDGEMNDTEEYERILSELRGSETSIARREASERMQRLKQAKAHRIIEAAKDERAKFDDLCEDHPLIQWLGREERAEFNEWLPLRASNPRHVAAIEDSPDRTVMAEEIMPFLFRLPASHHMDLVIRFLALLGVRVTPAGVFAGHEQDVHTSETYQDGFLEYQVLLVPILEALNGTPDNRSKSFHCDRLQLLSKGSLCWLSVDPKVVQDPQRVQFIRNLLRQTLQQFEQTVGHKHPRLPLQLKCIWLQFESVLGAPCGELIQYLSVGPGVAAEAASGADEAVTMFRLLLPMFELAKLELVRGNLHQSNRICEKTIGAVYQLGNTVEQKTLVGTKSLVHRMVYLRLRNELSSTEKKTRSKSNSSQKLERVPLLAALRLARAMYVLCFARNPSAFVPLDRFLKKHQKHNEPTLLQELRKVTAMDDGFAMAEMVTTLRKDVEEARTDLTHCSCFGVEGALCDCALNYSAYDLCVAVYATQGFEAACEEFERHLEWLQTTPNATIDTACGKGIGMRVHLRAAVVNWLEFIQFHFDPRHCGHVLAPKQWRGWIRKCLDLLPTDALLLRLFVDAESNALVSQTLQKHFYNTLQRHRRLFEPPTVVEWLFALLCEFVRAERATWIARQQETTILGRRSAPSTVVDCCLVHRWQHSPTSAQRIRTLFEASVQSATSNVFASQSTSGMLSAMCSVGGNPGNALLWRLYLRFEVAMGKVEAAKKVFYRGLSKCAWSKALYLDGFRVLGVYLSEREREELVEFMAAKEIHVRTEA